MFFCIFRFLISFGTGSFITEEDGDLWFNKPCQSGRVATAIKDGGNSVLYMYIGGGAVDHEQSYLLGGLVVLCKSWRWAALVYAAARVVGLASNNSLGPFSSELVISIDDEDKESTTSMLSPHLDFHELCESIWKSACSSCDNMLYDMEKQNRTDRRARSIQSETIGFQLSSLKSAHAAAVTSFLSESV